MTLQELIDELRTNILNDRSDRVAGSSDYLWEDATLIRYINEAQNRFARSGLVIRDNSTPEVVEVPLVAGEPEYLLHSSILSVVSAKMEGDRADLGRTGHNALGAYRSPDTRYFDPSQVVSLPDGRPIAFATDETLSFDEDDAAGVVEMRVYPTPSAAYAGDKILLRVIRMPLEPLIAGDMGASPEIPATHHLDMLDWAAYLALRVVDIDAGMDERAEKFKKSFEQHVAEARKIVTRKMFAPLKWGFGRNGYTWER